FQTHPVCLQLPAERCTVRRHRGLDDDPGEPPEFPASSRSEHAAGADAIVSMDAICGIAAVVSDPDHHGHYHERVLAGGHPLDEAGHGGLFCLEGQERAAGYQRGGLVRPARLLQAATGPPPVRMVCSMSLPIFPPDTMAQTRFCRYRPDSAAATV